ncbi:MAG: FixH family protein [Pseudobdellovibrionaceae bacterium]
MIKQILQSMAPDSDNQGFPKWVIFYFAIFFGVIFVVNGAFVYLALESNTGVVTEHSYEQGLHYNATIAKSEKQEDLNLVQHAVYEGGVLTWSLKAADGTAITHASVTGRVVRPVQDGYDFDISFENAGDGTYISRVAAPLPGKWTVRLKAEWDTHSYQTLLPIIAP